MKVLIPVLSCIFVLNGCALYIPASSKRLDHPTQFMVADDVWPVQDTGELQEAYDTTPAVIERYALGDSLKPDELTDAQKTALDQLKDIVRYKGIHAGGLLRVFETHEIPEIRYHFKGFYSDQVIYGFIPNARLLSVEDYREWKSKNPVSEMESSQESNSLMVDLSSKHRLRLVDHTKMVPLNEGQAIRVPDIQQTPPKGVIIHFTALFGNKYETKLLDKLRQSGWAIIDINTQTRIDPPVMNAKDGTKYNQLEKQIDQLMTNIKKEQIKTIESDDEEHSAPFDYSTESNYWKQISVINKQQDFLRSFHTGEGTTIDEVGQQLARAIDKVIAKNAFAAEAMLDYVAEARTDLPTHPTILLGLSAGSLVVPAAAARLGDRIDAAVMVGAGTDLFTITQKNPYSDGGIRVRDGDQQPSRSFLREVNESYLKYTRLDPAKTAGALNDKPVLLMRGIFDSVVPAHLGRDLSNKLNEPDCIIVPGGHGLVFFLLPGQSKNIEQWMEKHTNHSSKQPS